VFVAATHTNEATTFFFILSFLSCLSCLSFLSCLSCLSFLSVSSFPRYRDLMEYSKSTQSAPPSGRRRVVYGATEMVSPDALMGQMASLNGSESKE
jgi:hypothetical protein